MKQTEDIVFIKIRWSRTLIKLLILLALLAGSLYMWRAREAGTLFEMSESRRWIRLFASYAGPPFALLYLGLLLHPVLRGGKAVRLDRTGITDWSSLGGGFGLIYWSEIERLEIHQSSRNRPELWIYLSDSAKTAARFHTVERWHKLGWFGFHRGIVGLQLDELDIAIASLTRSVRNLGGKEISH